MTDYDHDFHNPAPEPTPTVILAVPHPAALNPRGITITCPNCRAHRDWLLLNVGPQVFVRCRCAHEWCEHDLEAVDVTAARGDIEGEREWESFDEMYRGLSFDGLFRYTYLN